ncbi:MAG: carboxypeptidase-like regulatory domain-containing protein [Rhodothermia bacterium]|nr:carboxypeptidase-like regulatory domain-containing protein [Rhodothermia bacterium]
MSRLLTLMVTLLLFSAGSAYGQKATVYGVVTETLDGDVYPIPFAKVAVSGEVFSSGPIVPDLEGVFRISDIPPGDYLLSVGALGFDTLKRPVTLSSGDSVEVRVSMGTGESAGIVLLREYVSDATTSKSSPEGTD